ncbi:hypothetical protein GNP80_04285 [Aliivibrio fischeri]|uniref:hypothetical protein n=1 Tax=Aliivibrio fischeri TaxID=668 RepID=UPI0012D88A51|nr:hypothetical protein [Aliivibrio fischeri]MUK91661.1 hypothetical protein [Aliivibrio fischeri]
MGWAENIMKNEINIRNTIDAINRASIITSHLDVLPQKTNTMTIQYRKTLSNYINELNSNLMFLKDESNIDSFIFITYILRAITSIIAFSEKNNNGTLTIRNSGNNEINSIQKSIDILLDTKSIIEAYLNTKSPFETVALKNILSEEKDSSLKIKNDTDKKISVIELNLSSINNELEKLNDKLVSIENKTNYSLKEIQISNIDLINNEKLSLKNDIQDIFHSSTEIANESFEKLHRKFEERTNNQLKNINSKINNIDFQYQDTINKQKSNFINEINELKKSLHKDIKNEVHSFANQKNKLTEILGSLSEFRRSKSDIDQAEKEGKTANRFRWIGLILMFLPLISFIAFFVGYKLDAEGVESLVFTFPDETTGYFLRFLTIVLFSSPSVYLLKESAYHRKQERHYRERGLQLASIGPFLDDFTPEQRVQAKNNLLKTFYCTNDGKADTSNVPDIIKQIQDVAKLSKSLSKIVPTHRQDNNQPQTSTNEQMTQMKPLINNGLTQEQSNAKLNGNSAN